MTPALSTAPNARRGFTLVELMVVLVIIAILSGLSLGGLARAASRTKADLSEFIIRKISDAITEHYETYEDLRLSGKSLTDVRQRMREELPDSWFDVFGSSGSNLTIAPTTPAGRAYARHYGSGPAPTAQYAGAECLYMIISQSGLFTDVLAGIRAEQIGDIDNDGRREFLDGWKQPISFIRWAPGFSSDPPSAPAPRRALSLIQIADPSNYHDPVDIDNADPAAFAMIPLVYSSGPDRSLGLIISKLGWTPAGMNSPCTFNPDGKGLIGAPDTDAENASDCLDNITNHQLIAE
jgi:prepilin-type N-terminal cleavage/methylation domain-containing protein